MTYPDSRDGVSAGVGTGFEAKINSPKVIEARTGGCLPAIRLASGGMRIESFADERASSRSLGTISTDSPDSGLCLVAS
jgi:hypothetical protein